MLTKNYLLDRTFLLEPRTVRNLALVILVALSFGLASAGQAQDEPKAREIMTRVDDREDGDNQTSRMQMRLIDKRGK